MPDQPYKGLGEWYSQAKSKKARQRPIDAPPAPEPGGTGVPPTPEPRSNRP